MGFTDEEFWHSTFRRFDALYWKTDEGKALIAQNKQKLQEEKEKEEKMRQSREWLKSMAKKAKKEIKTS